MASLIERIRSARRSVVTVEGHTYTIRRPTDEEAMSLSSVSGVEIVRRFVDGWDHTELSLGIPGGTAEPVKFDLELWSEWVADQPRLWAPLAEAVISAYTAHRTAMEESAKN